jgi:SAM-dependent methyltransferase
MKTPIGRIPILGSVSRKIYRALRGNKAFPGSEKYWIQRYESEMDSGAGSYDKLAEFKAEVINDFVEANNIASIIDYGCGDGNQLKLAKYPSYIGFDVSPKAIALCRSIFQGDDTKVFRLMDEYCGETAELTISLDVIFHLVEDDIYHSYMERLFSSSEKFVIIYSSNFEERQDFHERRRRFTDWVEEHCSNWKLIRHIPNRYPFKADGTGSLSDFFVFQKAQP